MRGRRPSWLQGDGVRAFDGILLAARISLLTLGIGVAPGLHAAPAAPGGGVTIDAQFRVDTASIAMAPDRSLIVSATLSGERPSVLVTRLLPDGKPAPGFGVAGRQTLAGLGPDGPRPVFVTRALAVQADGRIVLAGEGYTGEPRHAEFMLVRLLADGSLDRSFNGRGWTSIRVGRSIDLARALSVQADGKLLVAGGSLQRALLSARYDFAIVRLLPDGRPDRSFGRNGKALLRFGSGSEDIARAVVPDRLGRILVAGRANAPQAAIAIGLAQLDAQGTPPPGFGRDGKVLSVIGGEAAANALAIQPDRGIVVAATVYQREAESLRGEGVVQRYTDAGRLDARFGTAGSVRLPDFSELNAVAVAPDGKLLLLGMRGTTRSAWAAIVLTRLNPDGSPDASFGEAGTVRVQGRSHLSAAGMVISDNGDIFVCAVAGDRFDRPGASSGNELLIHKFDASGRPDAAFGP